jgi:hypothetical protein
MSAPLTALSATPAASSSTTASTSTGGLPIANATREPAAVRDGSPAAKQAYATAQGFEEMLLGQLSQSLVQSSGLGGEGEGSSEGSEEGSSAESGGGMLASLLPQTLTEGVMRQGGLGLATQLMGALDPSAATAASVPATSVPATTGGAGA